MLRTIKNLMAISLCLALAACGTDTGSGDHDKIGFGGKPTPGVTVTTSNGASSNKAGFSLRLTDAPIDGLAGVIVQFTAIEMKRKHGGWTRYSLETPQPIDLLSLHGLTTADLLLHMAIEPGDYRQIRFIVDDTPLANHVILQGGGMENLDIPGGATTGIKIRKKFTIPENYLVNLTVDFDLRKSVKYRKSTGKYRLKPRMRLLVDNHVGLIRGSVDPSLLLDPGCSDADADTDNAAYVYNGHDVTPGDIDEPSNAEPVTSTAIGYDAGSGLYIFEAAFLPAGDYTIAFTCNANEEVIDEDDDGDDNVDTDSAALRFFGTQNVTVLVADTTFLKP